MNISHLKKQAKNLTQILPIYLAEHKYISELSACQELAARINEFPNWHSVVKKSAVRSGDALAEQADSFETDAELLPSLTKAPVLENQDDCQSPGPKGPGLKGRNAD